MCIPLVRTLKSKTESFLPSTPVGFNLQQTLIHEITRFSKIEDNLLYASAILLDPRFRKAAFQSALAVSKAVTHVGKLVSAENAKSCNAEAQMVQIPEAQVQASSDDFWSDFDPAVKQSVNPSEEAFGGLPTEFRQYVNRPVVSRKENPNPILVWKSLQEEYCHVYKVALRYLTTLATSVPSERLFSHAAQIANQLRNRLSEEHVDMLVFLRSVDPDIWSKYRV